MSITSNARPIGVILMTFGAAKSPEDVPTYLNNVYRGKAPQALIEEFQRRYRLVGGSPLVEITRAQADALQARPTTPRAATRGVTWSRSVCARLLRSSQRTAQSRRPRLPPRRGYHYVASYSPIIMGGYGRAVEAARAEQAAADVEIAIAGAWHTLPGFLDALATRVREALDRLPPAERDSIPVLLTAHSLPESVVAKEPNYLDQIMETVLAVAKRAGLQGGQWQFAYQSAGHAPEPWLTPDLKDLLPALRERGARSVLVVPVQVLADHLEILYDLDVAAREEASEAGLEYHRIEMFNTMPEFIAVLAQVVERELAAHPAPR
ncbi:MAG: ferrochelatase [Chloroflexia bacterium]